MSVVAWYITPPVSQSDWTQLASLLAEQNKPPSDGDSTAATRTRIEKLQWDLWGRRQAENAIYKRYVRTARHMQGSKYSVLLAKEWGQVLGVAEMGISTNGDRRATLGVLCVSPTARRTGVGRALVARCEEIASNIWHEDVLWVEVEATNEKALSFFSACEYYCSDSKEWSMVPVQQQRGVVVKKPHVVLSKTLSTTCNTTTNATAEHGQAQS